MRTLRALTGFTLLVVIFAILLVRSSAQDSPIGSSEVTAEVLPDLPTETLVIVDTSTVAPSNTLVATIPPTSIDASTETPTPTFTIAFTNTETPTESAVATSTTDADTASESSQTPSQTATATSISTPFIDIPWSLLISQSFDDPSLPNWMFGQGWLLVPIESGSALQVTNSLDPAILSEPILYNFVSEINYRSSTNTGFTWTFRSSVGGKYSLIVDASGSVQLLRNDVIVASSTTPITGEQWHQARIYVLNEILRISIDGIELIAYQDPTPLPPGTFQFNATFAPQSDSSIQVQHVMQLDNLEIWIPTSDWIPSPTPTPTIPIAPIEMPIATAYPIEEVTAEILPETTSEIAELPTEEVAPEVEVTDEPFPDEPPLSLVFNDNFDSGISDPWAMGSSWSYQSSASGQSLHTTTNDDVTTYIYDDLYNVVVETRFEFSNGSAQLHARSSIAGQYTAAITSTGDVNLFRGSALIETTNWSFDGLWHTLRLSVIDNILRVSIDGTSVIEIRDNAPLPPGIVGFSGSQLIETPLLVDDFILWASTVEIASEQLEASALEMPIVPTPGSASYGDFELLDSSPMIMSSGDIAPMALTGGGCQTHIDRLYAIVAPPTSGTRAEAFYAAIAKAHEAGSVSPYSIYLCEGTFPLNLTVVIHANVKIYGRGIDVSRFTQIGAPNVMGGMFTINGTAQVEFHNVTVEDGRAHNTNGGATQGGAFKVWNGDLGIYDSYLRDNTASTVGGAIMNFHGRVRIERTVIDDSAANNGDGGAIQLRGMFGGPNPELYAQCVRFVSNFARRQGGVLAVRTASVVIINNSSFLGNNLALEGIDLIKNIGGVQTNATSNWWETTPSVPSQISANVDASSPLGTDPTATYATSDYEALSPCKMNSSVTLPIFHIRDVPLETRAFHDFADIFGLPMPFEIMPIVDEEIGILLMPPYGGNTLSFEDYVDDPIFGCDPTDDILYDCTFGIHTGIDYTGFRTVCDSSSFCNEPVRAICDGIVVRGRRYPQGGTASPGYGVSVRCFVPDIEGDGTPNLSNIVITYNHLIDPPPVQLNAIVEEGQYLGNTGFEAWNDHLHFEAYIARGFESLNSYVRINPFLLFSNSLVQQHHLQNDSDERRMRPFYPTIWARERILETAAYEYIDEQGAIRCQNAIENCFRIFPGDLNVFSFGGEYPPSGGVPAENFWELQEIDPIRTIEWPTRIYTPAELFVYLNNEFSNDPFEYPNCIIVDQSLSCPNDDLTTLLEEQS